MTMGMAPGTERTRGFIARVTGVFDLSERETRQAGPRIVEAQAYTDTAAHSIRRGDYKNAANYGTAVHTLVKRQVDALEDPDFRAEISFEKSKVADVNYGTKNSIRIDILEMAPNNTVCFYDIKTGKAGLTPKRIREIQTNVAKAFGGIRPIIYVEMRVQ
jgi:hypothetical protein